MDTYFDLISLPLSYVIVSHFSFLMQVWVFIQQFRHMRGAIYFRMSTFWERISDYLINCVYFDFVHGLYSIDALRPYIYQKRSKDENMASGPRLFYFGRIKSDNLPCAAPFKGLQGLVFRFYFVVLNGIVNL